MPPQLAASPGSAAPNLSLSHAGPYIAIAVGFGCPVGIDVEWRRMLDDLDGMARLALTATEAKDLATLSADAKNDAFLRWWTAKEAALKAIGRGFSTPPDEVSLRYDAALLPDAALIPDGSTTHRYRISSYDKSPAAIVAIATADGVAIAVSAVKATQILRWC